MAYKTLTYADGDRPCAGILVGDTVYDARTISGRPDYGTMLGILDDWMAADGLFADFAAHAAGSAQGMPLTETKLCAPILYPGQIWAAGANYQDHIDEMAGDGKFQASNAKLRGGRPWHFSKSSRSAIIAHGTEHPLPPYSKAVDWEIELAVVIGRTASRVPAAEALNYVAGYTVANDLSARDFVFRSDTASDSPFRFDWLSHKGFDGACPMGPWITPARFILDPHRLDLKLWIDDVLMQNSNTKYMIFSIAEQIEEISARVTMNPGDVILTGTPAGVGMGRGIFLKPGQKIRLWIEGIGELHHSFTPS